jgi:RimJ/RimL family protein N-acetyltransferase
MYSSHVLAAVGAERRRSLHRQATADGLVRSATAAPPVFDLDGVLIRPIRPTDAAGLRDGFGRLGLRSRRLRFLGSKPSLSDTEVAYFTEVDHELHEALVAVDTVGDTGIGVARFIRDPLVPEVADVAITVVDDWQGRGVGSELLRQLTDLAGCRGVRRFTALVSADNLRMRRMLARMADDVVLVGRDADTLSYEIHVQRPLEPCA